MLARLLAIAAFHIVTYAGIGTDELRSTVTLVGPCDARCPAGDETIGAGEIIARRPNGQLLVLTARHVVANARWLAAFTQNGIVPQSTLRDLALRSSGRMTTLVAYAVNVDLAVVSFWPRRSDDYAIAALSGDDDSQAGFIVGAPRGALWTASPYALLARDATTFGVSCDTCGPGDSGGGVFDAGGRLVGIVIEEATDGDKPLDQFLAISLGELHRFLANANTERALATAVTDPRDVWRRFDAMRFP